MKNAIWGTIVCGTTLLGHLCLAAPVVTKEPVLESDKPGAEKLRVALPVLEEGEGKGNFIYYNRPKFIFIVNNVGSGQLLIKDDSGEVSPKGKFNLGGGIGVSWRKPTHYDEKKRVVTRSVTRPMISFNNDIRPTYNPGNMAIKAKLLDNVDFQWRFQVSGDTIELKCAFKCPNVDYPSRYGFSTEFPRTMSFDPSVDLVARQEALKGWYLRFDSSEMKKGDIKFSESAKLPKRARKMEVFGPWGKRKFILATASGSESMRPGAYSGSCPHEGFSLDLGGVGNGNFSNKDFGGIKIIIE